MISQWPVALARNTTVSELGAGLEGTTAPFEEIRLAVMFFLSQDEHCERHEYSGGNSDQGPQSDNPLAVQWARDRMTYIEVIRCRTAAAGDFRPHAILRGLFSFATVPAPCATHL